MDCLFCKIIAGEIPNHTVYEDDNVLAFLDIHPCCKGHTVLVPKKHLATSLAATKEEWEKIMEGLRLAIHKVESVIKPDGMNVGINDRPTAGQAVSHMHWHIIPRFEGDGGGSMHSIVRPKENVDVKSIAEMFK